jgi:hypothetical protein
LLGHKGAQGYGRDHEASYNMIVYFDAVKRDKIKRELKKEQASLESL